MTIERRPTERAFGLSVGAVCAALGAWNWWRDSLPVGTGFVVVGALLMGLGVAAPAVLRAPNRVWWHFAQALGWFNSRLLLTLFFLTVLMPLGVAMRLFGRNPLVPAQRGTNWVRYPRRRDSRHYEHPF